jgi:hypothetical protein
MKKIIFLSLSLMSLLVCLISPFLYFFGRIEERNYKWIFLLASVGWFVFATLWSSIRKKTYHF